MDRDALANQIMLRKLDKCDMTGNAEHWKVVLEKNATYAYQLADAILRAMKAAKEVK